MDIRKGKRGSVGLIMIGWNCQSANGASGIEEIGERVERREGKNTFIGLHGTQRYYNEMEEPITLRKAETHDIWEFKRKKGGKE